MADNNEKPRTSTDVQADYNNLLFRLGVTSRAAQENDREAKMIGETLDKLKLEYNQLVQQEKQAAEAAKAAAVPAPDTAPTSGAV